MNQFKVCWFLLLLTGCLCASAQVTMHKQVNLNKWQVAPGDYSGIVWLGNNNYAVVSDKEETDGYIPFKIDMDLKTGKIQRVMRTEHLKGNPKPHLRNHTRSTVRDCEGIVYLPARNSFFISGEGDQQILEYDASGAPTGRALQIPQEMDLDHIHSNYGFEALAYSPETHLFWTTSESCLKQDGVPAGPDHPQTKNMLRLQSFDEDLKPAKQYAYFMDACTAKKTPRNYAFGVPEIIALPSGVLLVMEREFYVSKQLSGSYVQIKIYWVDPNMTTPITFADKASDLTDRQILSKHLITQFKTQLTPKRMNIANYEGMCLGPTLEDGRHTILLINDSQHGYGKAGFHLHDYLRVLLVKL